jgi:hypothetical protein
MLIGRAIAHLSMSTIAGGMMSDREKPKYLEKNLP